MRYAGFWSRFGPNFMDFLVLAPFMLASVWATTLSPRASIVSQVAATMLGLGYHVYCHAVWGQTIGKRVAGVRVVGLSGARTSWRESFLRSSVDIVFGVAITISCVIGLMRFSPDAFAALSWTERTVRLSEFSPYNDILTWTGNAWFYSELIVLLFNQQKRALHDFIAGTVVVHTSP